MIKTVLSTTLLLGLAATTLAGTAEARGFGGGFHGGSFHGGGFHHSSWGHGFGWRSVGFTPFYGYGCAYRRVIDDFGNIVVRRVCD